MWQTICEEFLHLDDGYLLCSFSICLKFIIIIIKESFKKGKGELPEFQTQEISCS